MDTQKELAIIIFVNAENRSNKEVVAKYISELEGGADYEDLDEKEEYEGIVKYSDIEFGSIGHYDSFEYGNEEYLFLTDEEADEVEDERLDDYIDECIISEIPEAYRIYFDRESWKSDARINGCRGDNLSSYDGYEREAHYDGNYYFAYRQN